MAVKRRITGKRKPAVGAKKRRVAGKAISAKPRKVAGAKKRRVGGIAGLAGLSNLQRIKRNIDELERKRKRLNTRIEKDYLALLINKEHQKLDNLMAAAKRAS